MINTYGYRKQISTLISNFRLSYMTCKYALKFMCHIFHKNKKHGNKYWYLLTKRNDLEIKV